MKTPSDRSRQRREMLKAKGLCTLCGKIDKCNTSLLCDECRKKQKACNHKWRAANKEYYYSLKNKWQRKNRHLMRMKLIEKYGGICSCCGEKEQKFLQVHHVDKDGSLHRKQTWNICADLIRNPEKYKVCILCANCHNAITYYGSCPHAVVPA